MDYASMHRPGISNFSSSSPHRLPTVSAAAALQDLNSSPTRCISTGLKDLDAVLQNRDPATIFEGEAFYGGVSKGKVTEICGPPGVGKTSLGLQLAASALYSGEGVIWIDAAHPIPGPRFFQILHSFQPLANIQLPGASSSLLSRSRLDLIDNLVHFLTPTLAHLIALLCNQTSSHPDPKTSLIVIDSFSTLIGSAFPRTVDFTTTTRNLGAPNPSSRKFSTLQFIINSLQKLAATRNIAIVIFSECVTKMRRDAGAVLIPSINTTAWEQGLGCRVALFRDWGWNDEGENLVNDIRLIEVVKAEGVGVTYGRGRLAAFSICEAGLQQINIPMAPTSNLRLRHPQIHHRSETSTESPTLPLPQKRKISATDFEIPDSDAEDDEDYGWAEEDEEEIPAMPPQWQGSEDILVLPPGEVEAEDESEVDSAMEEEGVAHGIRKEEIVDSEDELAL